MAEVGPSQLPRPAGLIEVDKVLDIGVGLRPMGWYVPKKYVCAEPYEGYAEKLRAAGFNVVPLTALDMLKGTLPGDFDAIYLLDVIEHMERIEGLRVLELAFETKPKQVVVSTPNGFLAQHGDAWGLGGEYWQEHRSGWTPADFPGWTISLYDNGAQCGGFTAVSP
jgi:hypothetical protein